MRPAVKPNGFEYYEYLVCYVDDIMSISHDPMKGINGIKRRFTLKGDKAEKPDIYLGSELSKLVND